MSRDGRHNNSDNGRGLPDELTLRVASALALACAALVLGYFGGWPFAVLIAAVASAMGWEWSNIVRKGGFDTAFVLQLGAIILAILFILFIFLQKPESTLNCESQKNKITRIALR